MHIRHESTNGPTERTNDPNERGSALIIAVLVLFLVAALGASASRTALVEMEVAGNYASDWRAFYAADGIAQASFNELIDLGRGLGRFPDTDELAAIVAPTVGNIDVSLYTLAATGAAAEGPLQTGFFQGLVALTRPYEVTLTARTTDYPPASSSVTMGSFFDIIPIFQFAVFYEEDLELLPGPDMTLSGRVHTNADLYLGANSTLTIDSAVTAAGDFFHRRKDNGSRPGGAVRVRDGLGNFPAVAGLDSTDPDWVDSSLARWRGNLRTREHGIPRLNLTISDPTNPYAVIEPGYDSDTAVDISTKIFYSADMDIHVLNGQAFDADDDPIALGTAISYDVMFDPREQRHMLLVELDVGQLSALAAYPAGPAVVYIGSFEPGDGIPDWEIDASIPLQEIIDAYNAWMGTNYPLPHANHVRNADRNVGRAIDSCVAGTPGNASGQINAATNNIDAAVNAGQMTAADAAFLIALISPLATCGVVNELDWPEEWEDYTAPYDGGDTTFAVKIVNGSTLAGPLTIATSNPLYLAGNYNSINKQPAALMADAITILSGAWPNDDLPHSELPLNSRVASSTTVNSAFMLGNTETFTGAYNGGVENLPRFLENWSGQTLTYRGSLIDLWQSRLATGAWVYGSPVYTAPIRDWEFDTDLLDPALMPPATPRVYALRVNRWRRD
jgi:hypothetical protein